MSTRIRQSRLRNQHEQHGRFGLLRVVRVLPVWLVGVVLLALAGGASAQQVPALLSYQGRLLVGATVFDGPGDFKFALINGDGSRTFWRNTPDLDGDGQPDHAVSLTLRRGLYSVLLGDTTLPNMAPLPSELFTNNAVYLRVWFNDGVNGFELLAPDERVASVGYALVAATVPDGAITAAKLAPGAVNTGNLVGVLTPAQIPNLDASQIASGVLDPNRIPGLDAAKVTSGSFPTSRLPANVAYKDPDLLTTSNALSGQLTSADTALSNQLFSLSAQVESLASQPAASAEYAKVAGTVVDGAITAAKLAPGAVNTGNLVGVLTPAQIPNLDASQIASGVLDPNRIPGLDAAKVTSGSFLTSRLPANVAYKDPDLLTTSNALSGQWSAANAALSAQVAALTAEVQSLSNLLQGLSNPVQPVAPIAVSTQPQDPSLMAMGYVLFATVASPPWINGTTANAPSARWGHSAVWTGQEMIVWGGTLNSSSNSGSAALYQPQSDQWRLLSPVDAPSDRSGHTAVWTGQEMIVWGGYGSGVYLGSGGRYQPNPQQWTALPTAGAPEGRVGHVAAWTGSRMVVWGGRNSTGLLADGGWYDLSASQWRSLALPSAPPARVDATAVWTGDRLIVWGGEGAAGTLNSGAQLVFDDQGLPLEWRAVSAAEAPAARTGHTAVWTGLRMLVWGGKAGSSLFGDGAAYDPIANTWQPLSTSGAPSPRSNHSALWTSTEMVVWGGEDEMGGLASGAAYEPTIDQWRTLSSAGNPQARSKAEAVWTGSELLVFGGRANAQAVGMLQRLSPQPAWYFYRQP
jgi:N-acetylneuraminic acid mutarotase